MLPAIPPVVFHLFPYDPDATLALVQEWMKKHGRDYMLKDPTLVTLDGKTFVWTYGSAGRYVADQADLVARVRSEAGQGSPSLALPSFSPPRM